MRTPRRAVFTNAVGGACRKIGCRLLANWAVSREKRQRGGRSAAHLLQRSASGTPGFRSYQKKKGVHHHPACLTDASPCIRACLDPSGVLGKIKLLRSL